MRAALWQEQSLQTELATSRKQKSPQYKPEAPATDQSARHLRFRLVIQCRKNQLCQS
jgi:hypothetical protein